MLNKFRSHPRPGYFDKEGRLVTAETYPTGTVKPQKKHLVTASGYNGGGSFGPQTGLGGGDGSGDAAGYGGHGAGFSGSHTTDITQ